MARRGRAATLDLWRTAHGLNADYDNHGTPLGATENSKLRKAREFLLPQIGPYRKFPRISLDTVIGEQFEFSPK